MRNRTGAWYTLNWLPRSTLMGEDFKKDDQRSITEQLDDMLEGAKIEPELIESLGDGNAQPQ